MTNWTSHQTAVFDWAVTGTGHAIVEAVAGSGKTTTLVETIRRIRAQSATAWVAICAYNKSMGDELTAKVAGIEKVAAGTVHSFGFKALRFARGKVAVDGYKVRTIIDSILVSEPQHKPYTFFVNKLVGLAKDTGIGFFCPVDNVQAYQDLIDHHDLSIENEFNGGYADAIALAIRVLKISNADINTVDFADMIYHVLLHNVRVQQYDFVLVDEAQDTNSTRRALAKKMLKPTGRLIAVGDPKQAIFGFTGADNDSLDQIRRDFNAKTLPLTTSFRCAKAIVAHARNWVSHITSADTAPEGAVQKVPYTDLTDPANKAGLTKADAILCRKNAPLVELAFTLIRNGMGVRIEGRDIGAQLITLIRKWKVKNLETLSRRLEDYREREVQKAQAKSNDVKAEQIADRCDCLGVLISRASQKGLDVAGLITMIEGMFGDSTDKGVNKDLLVLSSIHRAKGREWDRVFLLGREQFQPSKFARQAWQMDQETNLIYVAITRAKHTLVEVVGVPV